MAEYQMVVGGFLNKPLTGRRPIETPETEINRANVLKVVMGKAEPIHLLNKNEIRFLHNYYLGSQPVLHRTKEYHAEITNRIVENHANEYPLTDCNCAQATAESIHTRTRYATRVATSATGTGTFKYLGCFCRSHAGAPASIS